MKIMNGYSSRTGRNLGRADDRYPVSISKNIHNILVNGNNFDDQESEFSCLSKALVSGIPFSSWLFLV